MDVDFIYRDKEGKALDVLKWGKLFEDPKYRFVGQDYVGDILISTVWIGVPQLIWSEHGFGFYGYFETAVLTPDTKELEMMRYETLEQAKLGHLAMIHEWKTKTCDPKDLERTAEEQVPHGELPFSFGPTPQALSAE